MLTLYPCTVCEQLLNLWLYISLAFTVYCKSFEVKKFRGWRTKLYFAGKHSRLDDSLTWQGLLHRLFHWESLVVPTDPRKPRNLSTSDDLQYTVLLPVDKRSVISCVTWNLPQSIRILYCVLYADILMIMYAVSNS